MGPTGPTGARGPKGDKGEQGIQEPRGATGSRGARGEKGDPASAAVTANLSMRGHKIVQLGNPTQDQDASHKKYVDDQVATRQTQTVADSRYYKKGESMDLGNNRITTLGAPTDRLDPVNKGWAEGTFIKRSGDNMQGDLSMGNNELTGIPNPTGPTDAANRRWVESVLPDETWHLLAHIKGSPTVHTTKVDDSKVQTTVYRVVGNDVQLGFYFKSDLEDGVYSFDFDTFRSGSTTGCDILLYGECGGSGYDSKTLYRFYAASANRSGKDYSVGRDSGRGKRFLRMYGPETQVHGQFVLRANDVFNHGKPFTLNVGGDNGDTYEFLKVHISLNTTHATGNKLLGSSLIFVFQPDGNGKSTFLGASEFKLWRVR